MIHIKAKLELIYKSLYKIYGPQGWWPIIKKNSKDTGIACTYHPEDYHIPQNKSQIYEICIGAILTQNTAWKNVEKALINLHQINGLNPKNINKINFEELKQAIRPAGYFNQKAKKIQQFNEFFQNLKNKTPSRENLLNVWGIGPETADSILLYAYKQTSFVIDVYTKRIFSNLGLIDENMKYDEVKSIFEQNIKSDLIIYQEYHALIVEHAKNFYNKKSNYSKDPLIKILQK